ncbi:cell wall-binding repeat-containing protein [Oceanobacillus alkalisoli]|uniref:cell wall-binding repeat-containing protein n=1 Tax=Oceanobacillus alkalisoli TaxID=2925113 RepID=UPI001EE4B8AB|nr:cell wall-binding repeat-containing protein [Oceanobacillus alkalisoli]MCG5102655.1 cell wall-binding repeat-containing protein [Oceanobacillus alkalisoli]
MKKQVNKLFVIAVAILAFGILSFQHVHAEENGEITFDFGENNVELTDTLQVEVVNEEENATIRITDSGEELYQEELSFVQVTNFYQVESESETYGIITYRMDGSGNGLYFDVVKLSPAGVEKVYTSDVFERANFAVTNDGIAIEYPEYEEDDAMTEPSGMVEQHFTIKGSQVEAGQASLTDITEEKEAAAQVNYKYKNPSYAEINKILTEEALNANVSPEIVKAIAYQESNWQQFWNEVPSRVKNSCKTTDGRKLAWDGTNALLGYDCIGIGIMQVSNHMYLSEGSAKDKYIKRLKEDIRFNVREGIRILKDKWNYKDAKTPIIPTVNNGDPMVIENWYFAIMAYNGMLPRNNPLENPYTAYQENVFKRLRDLTLIDITPFPTQKLEPYQLSNGQLRFRSNKYQMDGPQHYSSQSLKKGETAYTNTRSLNLRKEPSTSSSVVASLPKGTKLTITGEYRGNNSRVNQYVWLPVRTSSGQTGWVSSSYVTAGEYVDVYPLEGPNRFETSVAISNHGWHWEQPEYVVIGRGDLPIDALTGSVLASSLDSPLLLTRNDRLTPAVEQELKRIQPKYVYILGGKGAISTNVEKQLQDMFRSSRVERIEADLRYGTAAKVADIVASKKKVNEVFITTGDEKSSDPLAIAPYAGEKNIPILLTNTKKLSEEARNFITKNNVSKVTIIGGKTAVSANVENELKKLTGKVERVSGKARFDTGLAIINKYYNKNQLDNIFVAQGMDIADALSAAPLAAKKGSPLVLTLSDQVPKSVNTWLKSNTPTKPDIYFLGGNSAIQDKVRTNIINLVK